jgi:peptidoglycan/LPS O-acetylase OafA/YrhL
MNEQTNYKTIYFFKGLDGLRVFATLFVVLKHVKTIREKYNLLSIKWISYHSVGYNAVAYFFVLSGFLITYILLREQHLTNDISIKKFYIKRVLRTWPLYFFIIIIGVVLIPYLLQLFHIKYDMPYTLAQTWHYYLFFMPYLVLYYFGSHLLQPLWTIGVEESFYFVWAPIVKFSKKYLLHFFVGIIILKTTLYLLCKTNIIESKLMMYLLDNFQFELFSVGAIGAYMLFNAKTKIHELFIFSKPAQYFILSLLATVLIYNAVIHWSVWAFLFQSPYFSPILVSCMLLYLIINISINEISVIKLEHPVLNFLGELTYGIYMFHMICIFVTIQIDKMFFKNINPILSFVLFYIILFSLIVLCSWVSKKYFEDKFINLRKYLIK